MSKNKKHRRRSDQEQPEDYTAYICMSGFKNQAEVKKAFREMEEESYDDGRSFKAAGQKAVSYAVFAQLYNEFRLPAAMLETIIMANYAVYLDGYNGNEFVSRTVFEEI